jgi:hypothetical protein
MKTHGMKRNSLQLNVLLRLRLRFTLRNLVPNYVNRREK